MCIFVHANVFVWFHFGMCTWSDINLPPLSIPLLPPPSFFPTLYLSWDVLSDREAVKFVCLSSLFDAVTFDRLKKFRPIKHLQIRSPCTWCYICAASGVLFPTHHKAACHPAPTSQSATGSHMVTKMADRDCYRHWLSVCRWVAHCYGYVILERLWLWVTYVPIYGCCESSINDLFNSDSSASMATGLNQRLDFSSSSSSQNHCKVTII